MSTAKSGREENVKKKWKIALCGVRGHTDKFGRMINSYEESETIAVWDQDYDKAAKIAEIVGNCEVYTSFAQLLELPELDAVVITGHNCLHKELVIQAASAGKHIFLEKPLTTKVEDAIEMRDAIRRAGVKFFMTDPFVNASTTFLKEFVKSGRLGKIQSVRVHHTVNENALLNRGEDYYEYDGLVQMGGHVCDTAGHPMHILHYLLGRPQRLYAKLAYGSEAARRHHYEQFETVVMDYPDEVTAIMEAGLITAGYTNCIEICGTEGVIVQYGLDDKSTSVRYRLSQVTEEDIRSGNLREASRRGDWVDVPREEMNPDPDDHIRYFVRMLAEDLPEEKTGKDPASLHGMNLDAAVELVEIIESIYASAESGQAVKVGK